MRSKTKTVETVVDVRNSMGCDRKERKKPDPVEAALGYLHRGWSVVPVQALGKRPLVRWEPFQHHCPEETAIEGWFRRWPDANVAIVTGKVSGLVVLDVDPQHGGDDSLMELERRYGALPETVESISGGGGRHVYFRHPGGELRNRVALAMGIDLRGDGGMIVAPPSIHPNGRRYEWEVSHHPDDVPLAQIPSWLLALARGETPFLGHPLSHWQNLVQQGVAEGERNNTIASLTGHLLWHGVDPVVAAELLHCWNRVRCRPPLSDKEVAQTVESIVRTHRRHHPDPGAS